MPGHGRGGKPKAGFPPRPQPLEIALRFPHFHRLGDYYFDFRKEPWRPAASLPPPGSFLDEKMLCYKTKVGRMRDPIGSRPPVRKFSL
jgi:hypothetical protein